MELLSPEKMKSAKLRVEEEQVARIRKLNDEESVAVRRLNTALAFEEEVRARANLIATQAEEIATQARGRAQNALGEVETLEARRKAALAPTIQREKDLELREQEIKVTGEQYARIFTEATDKNRQADDRIKAVEVLEGSIAVRIGQLDSREEKLVASEISAQEILDRAILKAKEIAHAAEKLMESAESRMADANMVQKANDATRIQLEADLKQVNQDKVAIKDGYATLASARKEILGS